MTIEERKIGYYKDILRRIADGWDSPQTLAELALDHEFHSEQCSTVKIEWAECNCGVEENNNAVDES